MDNLTNGRLVMGFLRGTPNEDQTYNVNPAEGRGRMLESMDLILRALTEPQPFGWQGRYYQFRTVAVWPRPVQQPFPPAIVATRSDDAVRYAAAHRLGLGVSFLSVDDVAAITGKYFRWCAEAGWTPRPDEMVFRGQHIFGGNRWAGVGVVSPAGESGPRPGDGAAVVGGAGD